MSLSFEDSLKKNAENNVATMNIKPVATMSIDEPSVMNSSVMTLEEDYGIVAYSGDDGNWQEHTGYVRYSTFSDDNISIINETKDINLDGNQFNITQEENSQYIPFEMPRYYDGYDLTKANISIHYNTKSGRHAGVKPVNVTYNDTKIRFGWLIDAGATLDVGTLEFEIHAYGTIVGSDGIKKAYTWKTKRNKSLTVLESLCNCEDTINNIDDSWLQELITDVAEKVAEEIKNVSVGEQVEIAKDYALRAETAANNAEEYSQAAYDSATSAVNNVLRDYIKEDDLNNKLGAIVDEDGYELTVEQYVKQEVESVDVSEQLGDLGTNEDGSAKTVVQYVNDAVNAVDVSDELGNLIDNEGNKLTVEQYVKQEVDAVDVSEQLKDYAKSTDVYTKEETYTKDEVDTALGNVTVDLTGYATEKFVTDKTDILSTSIGTNTENISSLNKVVVDLQDSVNSIDTSPRLTYDITYNDMEDVNGGENKLVFYEIENEGKENEIKTPKKVYTIVGGSGGSSSSNTLYIDYDLDKDGNKIKSYVFTMDNMKNKESVIRCTFHGVDASGDSVSYANGTWQFRRGTSGAWTTVETKTIYPDVNIELDVSKYISVAGTYQFKLDAKDDTDAYAYKTWTVQLIKFELDSNFNDKIAYPIGSVIFDYTPHGAISKDIHFVLDGEEIKVITTTSSGIANPVPFEIPTQTHGSHLLESYMTAEINGNKIESNHLFDDIIWYDSTSTVPVIGTTYQNFTAKQYESTNIEFTVYDPSTEYPRVEIAVNGEVEKELTLEKSNTDTYTFKTDVVGEHIITITCGSTVKTLIANVTKLDIDISPVTAGLVFDFDPSKKSNNDTDRLWTNGDVSMSVSDNFDWVNGGYQYDKNGDKYFCIKAGTSATIDYKLFADEAKRNGKEMKLVFKTSNVAKPDATFLHCVDNTTDSDHVGIRMDVHEAIIFGQSGNLELSYSEEDIIEFEFNISKNTEAVPMVMGYEDGVSTRPMVYDDSYNFTQNTPKFISLGSEDCDLHIYRFKVYNTSLTDRGILNNFIADARNAEEMIARYERNQIYDENQNLDPDVLAEKCPWLRIIKLEAPYFTNHKDNRVGNTTVEYIYKNGTRPSDNWKATDSVHSGQGTSSNNYGAAGRNLDIMVKRTKDKETGLYLNENPIFNLSDGTQASKVSLTEDSVPVNYFNIKVNIASSNNLTNAILAKKYNEFNPYNRPFVRENENEIYKIKDTMEFHNCVVFIKESDPDLTTHREFADNEWHFYAIGNIGDSKKTDDTRLTDMDDKYECCVEIMDVEKPLSDFPVDTMMNAMAYTEDEVTHEKVYTWAKNENLGILYEKINGQYVLTKDTEVDLNKVYYVDILEHDDFSEDYTYGWRYIWEDGDTDEENEEVFNYCKQKWIELYRFITTSTDQEFKANLGNYFVLDSALYNYLFTTRYCMVDNRAKNTFWHYGKTGEVDSDGNPIRKWDLNWGYDMDTSLGLNNYGKQVYRYGLEDTDVDEKGEEIFREMDSMFFCRIRDLFRNELKSMYNLLEKAWNAESFITQCDEWQSQFPEELWRIDIDRKYIRTYNSSFINSKGNSDFLTIMSNGKMKYHRRQWERNQEQYMASKYQSTVASGDDNSVIMRCSLSVSDDLPIKPNYKLKLTPYSYMYLNVEYNSGVIQIRAVPNVEYEIPYNGGVTDIIKVYSASCIQSLGDLSSCYLATINTTPAIKLKELIIGNSSDGYDNPYLTSLTTGANYLLEKLNVEKVSGLTQSLNLSALSNLRELYAYGSNISGVAFADGGKIEIAELPAITSISMKNLIYLTSLNIVDLNKLTTLIVENCNTVDLLEMLDKSPNVNRVRITGIDWTLEDTSLLERLYNMGGKDKDGGNLDKSVLAGKIYVPTIKQKQLEDYRKAWSDLDITYNDGGLILQYPVTFVNYNGEPLYVEYIDEGGYAFDPVESGNIGTPIKPSTISTDYTFVGWDNPLTSQIFTALTVTATYTESTRAYTIKYVSKGTTLQETVGLYGENVPYTGNTPTYTLEEGAYNYYLFNRWDKSGFIDGDKTVNAMFDNFKYSSDAFNGKRLSDLSPVQIYALTKLTEPVDKELSDYGMNIAVGDRYSFEMGYDIDYDDIESTEIISNGKYLEKDIDAIFSGSNYIDTGIKLFDEDRDFVLAIDYKISSDNTSDGTFMQCYQGSGSNGFKLGYASGSTDFIWGSSPKITPSSVNARDMLVIRHKKGDNNLYVYTSRLDSNTFALNTIEKTTTTHSDTATLVFGASKLDSGRFSSHCIGNINWCKIWYKDLGEDVCEKLVGWTHEKITLGASGSYRYSLYDDPTKETMVSLVGTHLLDRTKKWNDTNTNVGGWASSSLNQFLNSRFYNAIPTQIKSLMKKMSVLSTVGGISTDVSESGCYVTIPSLYDVDTSKTAYKNEVYIGSSGIGNMATKDTRKRAFDGGDYNSYWTRSPNVEYSTYIWRVEADGTVSNTQSITAANNSLGVLIEISF